MFKFTDKLSPRVIGSAIKSRISGQMPTHNDSPYNKVVHRLTKISKVAKEARYKKRNICRFSATAMLIVSQTGIKFLHQAIVHGSKPVIHRRVNTLPHETERAMTVDEVPTQPEELNRPCMPALIAGGFNGKDVDQIDQIRPSRVLTENLFAWRQAGKWDKGNLQRICLSRAQIAAIERRKEREEDKAEERQRMVNRQPPKPLQRGDSIKRWYSDWKAKEWQKKRAFLCCMRC